MYVSERNFVSTAHAQMQVLEDIWDITTGSAVTDIQFEQTREALNLIKHAASTVMARGVYRAASLCEDVFDRMGDDAIKLRASLVSLQRLIGQYAHGLFELDPDFKLGVAGAKPINSDDVLAADTYSKALANDAPLPTVEEAHRSARDILAPLLSLVKDEGQEGALKTLMQPTKPAENVTIEGRREIRLDAVMRPVTNLTLSEARHSGKKVVLSYAADFDVLEAPLAKRTQEFLEVLCLNIVAQGISAARETATQISITGQGLQNALKFTLNWTGRALETDATTHKHFFAACEKLKTAGGEIICHESALNGTGSALQNIVLSIPINRTASVAEYPEQSGCEPAYGTGG